MIFPKREEALELLKISRQMKKMLGAKTAEVFVSNTLSEIAPMKPYYSKEEKKLIESFRYSIIEETHTFFHYNFAYDSISEVGKIRKFLASKGYQVIGSGSGCGNAVLFETENDFMQGC